MEKNIDVLVIGAGPSGSILSSLLHKNGLDVLVVDKEVFPRFVIGESLLPFCMHAMEQAGLLDAVMDNEEKLGFQYKNGAAFARGADDNSIEYTYIDFCDKSSKGFGTTFQVRRGVFDKLLIDTAAKKGVNVLFGVKAEKFDFNEDENGRVTIGLDNGDIIKAKYVVDGSGYGRVLPKALNLDTPSDLTPKIAYFTHIEDKISHPMYDRDKILITTHPEHKEIWFWLIPFSDGRCSIGVVGEKQFIFSGDTAKFLNEQDLKANAMEILKAHVYKTPMLKMLLKDAVWDTPANFIYGYSSNVTKFYDKHFVLLGNAGEFLDPVFSSGVTIAMHAATLLAPLVTRIIKGESVDMTKEYVEPLSIGIKAFKTYVNGWYDGTFQDVIYTKRKDHSVTRQISSVLAGYAWDSENPFVTKSDKALKALYEICKNQA